MASRPRSPRGARDRQRATSAADTSRPRGSVKRRRLRRCAGLAAPEQVELVALEREALGRPLAELVAAPDQVVHAIAGVATEVVVMPHAREFVARRLARQLDLRDVALVEQALDGAIHRSHAQSRRLRARCGEDLGGTQRAAGCFENLMDGLSLRRRAFHCSFSVERGPEPVTRGPAGDFNPPEPPGLPSFETSLRGGTGRPPYYCGTGGERGIRTLEAVLAPTRFPIVLLQPLGHLSAKIRAQPSESQAAHQ